MAALVSLGNGPAIAALTYYDSRIAFDSDNPGLPVDDFEGAGTSLNFDGPVDSTTNNGMISPGDILPGLTITTDSPGSFDLRVDQLATT